MTEEAGIRDDRALMELAVDRARQSVSEPGRVSPRVGAVVSRDGVLLGEAFRGELGNGQHAEFTLLEQKLGDEVLSGTTLFTTLEPCTSRNSPKIPCVERIVERRIRRVVIGMLDPNEEIRGRGELRLRQAGIEVTRFDPDLMAQLEELNRGFARLHAGPTIPESTVEAETPAPSSDVRSNGFFVLGGDVARSVEGGTRPFALGDSESDRWLLVALLLDGHISSAAASAATSLSGTDIRKRITDLVSTSGLEIASDSEGGYTLDQSNIWVDGLELLALVEQARSASPEGRYELLKRARALWKDGPPDFADGFPTPDRYLAIFSAYEECLRTGRRILVVDDQIADELADRLRVDHVCEVARSFDEYRAIEERLGTFDLVVLDRHLRTAYRDSTGDRIAETINQRTDGVPVMMMTYRLPSHTELGEWQLELGLAGAIIKETDGGDASVDEIAAAVGRVLAAGPVEAACSAIEAVMVSYTRKARKIITRRHQGSARTLELERMTQASSEVVERASANDLVGARQARDSFRRKYLT